MHRCVGGRKRSCAGTLPPRNKVPKVVDTKQSIGFDARALMERGVPRVLLRIMVSLSLLDLPRTPIDVLELFAGARAVTRACQAIGLVSIPFEIKINPKFFDLCSPVGFLTALFLCMRLKSNGMLWLAPVCSSWVFMNRGTSQRSWWNPLGQDTYESVRQGNLQVSRCMLLVRLVEAAAPSGVRASMSNILH
jgi:hypothetical protein